jgi:uncharacterized membrane protein YphA (DoxX/SURF4 family)
MLLGLLFLMTGVMKFAVPSLREAFSGQLTAAGIPFHAFNMWAVPAAETGLGALLVLDRLARLATLSAMGIMAVAAYVHVAVNDPALFPVQPQAPVIPAVVMVLGTYLLWIGSGGRSRSSS